MADSEADGDDWALRQAPLPIEDYALIADCRTAALVGRDGAIDWLCLPRFDSPACFAALLGTPEHGSWLIGPCAADARAERHYRDGTLVLETVFSTPDGEVALIDAMILDVPNTYIVRRVEGRRGRVDVRMHLTLRFDYGLTTPWVTREDDGLGIVAIAGPNLVVLHAPVALRGQGMATIATFAVAAGESLTFVLGHGPSHLAPPDPVDGDAALVATEAAWREWAVRCTYKGPYKDAVLRSLIVLKALTYAPTGGIVAAPTTSLPEQLGGVRNWDYRFCWLRDATLTVIALMGCGYYEEAQAWRDWLHRSIAGNADEVQIMYGVAGERYLFEHELPWLPGYQGAQPVRIGNEAATQLQLDIYGEVMDALHHAREGGLAHPESAWDVQLHLTEHLEKIWREPDDGIWEVRGGRKHFTHSKMMAWVAVDRMVRDARKYGLEAPVERWRALRDAMHREICEHGFNASRNAFTQCYGGEELDASLLLMPMVGFLPSEDPRVSGTVEAIADELVQDGLVQRYKTESGADGLPPGEGVFLPCSFWLADDYAAAGRMGEAEEIFQRLLGLRNDVGLLAEEYDPRARRQTGNFPQAFSHLALVSTAISLYDGTSAERRGIGAEPPDTVPVPQ